ncbi:hypothetical protein E0H77_08395 [Acinetobacter sp. ANC 4633]|uniref:hypothetical protein n=1 Tax=Acinetobacter sp. ANC 4633 TaxID=2529845 RepID=UPI00103A0CC8|nr:hypothetical protein [Acinetobacter sp. ANC 4633]TCB25867.1 hypothetical protein E0H77_08395 [Acinetobacter sp. ANC 4633]
MNIDNKKLDALLSNEFEIDCIMIELTQQTESNPIIYKGAGSLTQKSDGNFYVKLYHAFNDISKEIMPTFGNSISGKIIGKDAFFSMEALDISGNIWTATDIQVSNNFSIPATGKVVNSYIKNLKCVTDITSTIDQKASFLFFVISGNFKIPLNKWEDTIGGGKALNTCQFSIDGKNIEIKDNKNCLFINIEDPLGEIDFSYQERFLEALSIITGKLCPVLLSILHSNNHKILNINSIPNSLSNKPLVSLLKHQSPWDLPNFQDFLYKYLISFHKEYDIFFGYWHKVNRAWQGSLENTALALCVAIEGVVKNYYKEFGLPDDEIILQAKEARDLIKKLDLKERIKNRIMSTLGQINSSNTKNALYELFKLGKIDKELIEAWVSLRNKAAHADNLNDDMLEIQKYLDDFYKVQNLFNLLLLLKIGYSGKYQDLAKLGWEESTMVLELENK